MGMFCFGLLSTCSSILPPLLTPLVSLSRKQRLQFLEIVFALLLETRKECICKCAAVLSLAFSWPSFPLVFVTCIIVAPPLVGGTPAAAGSKRRWLVSCSAR